MTFRFLAPKSLIKPIAAGFAVALTAAPHALANGGNDPIEGIDIIIKENPSQAQIKPFSLDPEEIAVINGIKGVERRELVLIYVAKRLDQDDRFVESGMKVMGKNWCGDCAWPERSSYKFKHDKVTYKLDLMLSDNKVTASK